MLGLLGALIPSKGWLKNPSISFIGVHYIYMIVMTMAGSVILFAGGMDYIDALFFAGGASTQSGLNTIDVNKIELYQQIILMLWACVTTPTFINTIVVFVRLYWFEKRFQHVIKEQRALRKTRTRSRSKSEAKEHSDISRLEQGVNGRQIRVLHETTKPNGMTGKGVSTEEHQREIEKMGFAERNKALGSEPDSSSGSEEKVDGETGEHAAPTTNPEARDEEHPLQTPQSPESQRDFGQIPRTITFSDQLPTPSNQPGSGSDQPHERHERHDVSQHIAFVQRQQKNAKTEAGTLRIPGPRDFERGEVPKELEGEEHNLAPTVTRGTQASSETERVARHTRGQSQQTEELNADDHTPRRGITIDEPEHPQRQGRISQENPNETLRENQNENDASIRGMVTRFLSPRRLRRNTSGSEGGLGERKTTFARSVTNLAAAFTKEKDDKVIDPMPYLSWQATTGRNSAFVGLTAAQREELGGIEYRALKLLAKILVCYYIGFHVLGMMVFVPWITYTRPWKGTVQDDGVNPGWWGVFTAASMFNDLGLTLTPDSMISFQTATTILLLGSFLIIIGNTGFPIMLRFIIWLLNGFVSRGTDLWDELQFLLDHPRRCFILLFPSRANWWLFWILVMFNCIDLLFFIILDLNDPVVTDLPPGYRVLNGWFQATSTRTAGFSSVDLGDLHPAIQVSYMIMMYISVLPIAISVRRTNVYEEKSLGLYPGEEQADMENPSYVGQHLRRQLSFDLWYVFLGFFFICIAEGDRLMSDGDPAFNLFAVLFEVVSAYGTVGLSLGYPGKNTSLSAEFHVISKLIMVAMMIRGRHRGLPYALDRAILLPSEKVYKREAEEADRRFERRGSFYGDGPNGVSRSRTFASGELDGPGSVNQQNTPLEGANTMNPAAGRDRSVSRMSRRGSGMSTASQAVASQKNPRQRARGSTLIAGGFGAGPTVSKYD